MKAKKFKQAVRAILSSANGLSQTKFLGKIDKMGDRRLLQVLDSHFKSYVTNWESEPKDEPKAPVAPAATPVSAVPEGLNLPVGWKVEAIEVKVGKDKRTLQKLLLTRRGHRIGEVWEEGPKNFACLHYNSDLSYDMIDDAPSAVHQLIDTHLEHVANKK